MKSIVFTGGGTLGHCLPNIAVYEYLKTDFDKFYYFGSPFGAERKAVEGIFEYMPITATKFSRAPTLKNLAIPFLLSRGVAEATKALKSIAPSVVFSKGGFVAVPTVLAAARLGIPVVSHESDLSVGLANRLTARRSKLVLTSFSSTAKTLRNGVYVGPPIRRAALEDKREYALKLFGLDKTKKVLLILGGSSGAKAINDFFTANLDAFLDSCQILHICGDKHIKGIKKEGYVEIGFLKDVACAYSVADLAVARCGSGVAFELLARKIPTLFIPLPKKASRGDQIENARYFEDKGLSLTLTEEHMCVRSIVRDLTRLDREREFFIKNMNAENFSSSAKTIARIVVGVANGEDIKNVLANIY